MENIKLPDLIEDLKQINQEELETIHYTLECFPFPVQSTSMNKEGKVLIFSDSVLNLCKGALKLNREDFNLLKKSIEILKNNNINK